MELKDLRSGMVVELRNSSLYMVVRGMDNYPNGVITSGDTWNNLSSYSHKMTSNTCEFFDIVRVYDIPFSCMDKLLAKIKDAQPIWEGNMIRWDKVQKDTKLYVKSYDGTDIPVFFAGYDERINEVEYYQFGATSWSNKRPVVKCHCEDVRLAED